MIPGSVQEALMAYTEQWLLALGCAALTIMTPFALRLTIKGCQSRLFIRNATT